MSQCIASRTVEERSSSNKFAVCEIAMGDSKERREIA